jgi:Pyridine nucleotide-disulphide oxidoreductase
MDRSSATALMPEELLEHMKVPEQPRVYLLGCLDRRVTLYSQQTRALNLVHALSVTGRLTTGARIAVIGGGVAGLTAAAGAALKGYHVTLLERERRLLHLLAGCDKRWLHPRIYDWPAPDSLRDDTEDLGVLTWSADAASRVAEQILAGWESVKARAGDRIREITGVRRVGLKPGSGSTRKITWEEPGLQSGTFDAVIIAVGFGIERPLDPIRLRSYWRDDDLAQGDFAAGRRVFISGLGDGGLTDLLRACMDDFRHENVVRELARGTRHTRSARRIRGQGQPVRLS